MQAHNPAACRALWRPPTTTASLLCRLPDHANDAVRGKRGLQLQANVPPDPFLQGRLRSKFAGGFISDSLDEDIREPPDPPPLSRFLPPRGFRVRGNPRWVATASSKYSKQSKVYYRGPDDRGGPEIVPLMSSWNCWIVRSSGAITCRTGDSRNGLATECRNRFCSAFIGEFEVYGEIGSRFQTAAE